MQIVVGSTAMKHFYPDDWREPSDLDIWHDTFIELMAGADLHKIPTRILKLIPVEGHYATPDALYTIKLSHLGWDSPMWGKHKQDVLHMKKLGLNIIPELHEALVEYWKVKLGDKKELCCVQGAGCYTMYSKIEHIRVDVTGETDIEPNDEITLTHNGRDTLMVVKVKHLFVGLGVDNKTLTQLFAVKKED